MDRRVKLILAELGKNSKVLNLGCADSATEGVYLHEEICKKVNYCLGIDIDKARIKELKKEGYNVVLANAENIKLGKKFDVIVAGDLIEHLDNAGKFLDSIRLHLKKNGKLILTTPNAWCYHRFINACFAEVSCHYEHSCWYDIKTLKQLLIKHGFKIGKIKFVKIPDKRKTTLIGNILRLFGFKQIGSESIFLIAKLS